VGLAETKNQLGIKFDEASRFYTCICQERRKNRRSNYEEGGNKQKKQNEKQDPFQFLSV